LAGHTSTEYSNRLAGSLAGIDQALENVNKVRSSVGSSLKELDSLTNTGRTCNFNIQPRYRHCRIWITRRRLLTSLKKMQLEAAQLSFKQISQLSLFSIL
jgi:flagellar hook-associated protein 3 FlgL